MYALLAQIVNFISQPALKRARSAGLARHLMEGAEACAGFDARQAQDLRNAAFAYLRVVR